MLSTLLYFFAAIATTASAQPPSKSARGENSFARILADPARNGPMVEETSAACVAEINRIREAGGDLSSSAIRENTKKLRDVRLKSGVQDDTFYHWTMSDGLFDLFGLEKRTPEDSSERARVRGLYDSMFKYLRERSRDGVYQGGLWLRNFYVAEDPISSKYYVETKAGADRSRDRLIEFRLDPTAPTFIWDEWVWKRAMNELMERFPNLVEPCNMRGRMTVQDAFATLEYHALYFLALEDSGVQVLEYAQGFRWFQVLTPEPFRSVRWIRKGLEEFDANGRPR